MNIYPQKYLEAISDKRLNVIAQCWIGQGEGDLIYPCENWNDCGKLIDELQIETDYLDGLGATASKNSVESSCYDNIKRAVTIVYILVKQAAK